MPTFRPLPARPSLEYARKEAKALLRRLGAGDPEAIARSSAHHDRIQTTDPSRVRLADAQLVVAREHGFASWPRLVRYLADVERQQYAYVQLHGDRATYERRARHLLADHGARGVWAGRTLAAYVPRFYGLPLDEVYASTVTEEEARLALARSHGAPSWEVLVERLEANARSLPQGWKADPLPQAVEAMRSGDLAALERVVATYPALLHPSEYDISAGRTLMAVALGQERRRGREAVRPLVEWLEARGFDRQRELNLRLCGHGMGMVTPDEVRALLDQGADPDWIAPNGLTVLEHALLRYWNGAAVDLLAAHTTPRDALWISAGLGDVQGVARFLDPNGKPTADARRHRPDSLAVGRPVLGPMLPDPGDEELLLETLLVAVFNGRPAVIEYLASRGAPLDSRALGVSLLLAALSHADLPVVEVLVRCGADPDLRGLGGQPTPREFVRQQFEHQPEHPRLQRLVGLLGMDLDAVLAERDARPAPTPQASSDLPKALALAGEDAARLGQAEVRPENLLIGLMRAGGRSFHNLKGELGPQVERFHADLADRLAPAGESAPHPEFPLDRDAKAAVDAAFALAAELRHEYVEGAYLLHVLTREPDTPIGRLLGRYGVDAAKLHARMERIVAH